jgi:TetR/AcrR family transcriptional regulator
MGKKGLKEKRDETIRHILDAATEVFADAGFAGARMDVIAKRAGVNKAMIYYRIGDKEALYIKVLHEVFGTTAERIARNIRDEHSPEEKLRSYIDQFARAIESHPSMPYIIMREMASRGRQLNEVIAGDLLSILAIVKKILDDGLKTGAFIQTDPLILHIMVIGVIVLLKVSAPMRRIFSSLLPDNLKGIESRSFEETVVELEKMILRAVKA